MDPSIYQSDVLCFHHIEPLRINGLKFRYMVYKNKQLVNKPMGDTISQSIADFKMLSPRSLQP